MRKRPRATVLYDAALAVAKCRIHLSRMNMAEFVGPYLPPRQWDEAEAAHKAAVAALDEAIRLVGIAYAQKEEPHAP